MRSLFILDKIKESYPTVIEKLMSIWDKQFYVVGGWVRDYLMGSNSPDLDLVIEGNVLELADRIKRSFPVWRIYTFKRYKTMKIVSVFGEIDIGSARKEYYPDIAARPVIEEGSIYDDMGRRDFTINAMAIALDTGEFIDPFNGEEDIKNGILRVLHDKSFIDDPTRMIRLSRYAVRFGFNTDNNTRVLLKESLDMKVFDFLARERLSKEILVIFKKEKEPWKVIEYMRDNGILDSILHYNLKDVDIPKSSNPVEALLPFIRVLPSDMVNFGLETFFLSADRFIKRELKEAGFGF